MFRLVTALTTAAALAPIAAFGAQDDIVMAAPQRPPVIVELGETRAPGLDVNWLRGYIGAVCGAQPSRTAALSAAGAARPLIILADPDAGRDLGVAFPARMTRQEAYVIHTVDRNGLTGVLLASRTPAGLRQAVLHLIREMRQDGRCLLLRPMAAAEEPWIPSREVMNLSCWTAPPDPRLDPMRYDRRTFDAYIDMFMSFGFNGMQVTDLSAVYKRLDPDIEKGAALNDVRCRQTATRVHLHAGSCTQWVWGGEIGADDPEYDRAVDKWLAGKRDGFEVDDPDLRRVFSRWYERYARFGDSADRLIVHYGEPGGRLPWKSLESQLAMHKFLVDHYSGATRPITFGTNLWRSFEGTGICSDELLRLVREKRFPAGHVFYEPGLPDEPPMPLGMWPWSDRAKLRRALSESGYGIGIWSDYLEDMESDGLAFMSVNDLIIKEFYNQVREKLEPIAPTTCWSTIDASHIVNVFSQYCAARLLWNPSYDTHALLTEITNGIWGPVNGPKVLSALLVIRDTRSGSTWTNYWFGSGRRRVGTDDPRSDLDRATQAISALKTMVPDTSFVPKFPLPVSQADLVDLILPNMEQIAAYAGNRLIVDEIVTQDAAGASREDLLALRKSLKPVESLGTWTGSWGPLERVAMKGLLQKLADTRVASGPLWWDKGTGLTYVKLCMESPSHAFDGSPATAYSPGGNWADQTTLKPPNDLGYAWLEPRRVSRVVIDCLSEAVEPASPSGVEIQYFDGSSWQAADVHSAQGTPGPMGNRRWVYEMSPVEATRVRAVFTKLRHGGAPTVAEMSYWDGDTRVDTPSDRP